MISYKEFTNLLIEAQIDDLRKVHGDVVDHYASHITSNIPHLRYILKKHKEGSISPSDSERIKRTIEEFEKHKNKLEKNSLNDYKDFDEVENALSPHVESAEKKRKKEEEARAGAEIIHQSPNLTIRHIKTRPSACKYGKNTKWCVSAEKSKNMFNHYEGHGNFYIVHGKDSNGKPHRYGIHFEGFDGSSNYPEFRDEEDNLLDPVKLIKNNPELQHIKEFQHKHPAFTSKESKEKLDNLSVDEARKLLYNKSELPNYRIAALNKLLQNSNKDESSKLYKLAVDKTEHPDVRAAIIKSKHIDHHFDKKDKVSNMLNDSDEHYRVKHALLRNQGNNIKGDDINKVFGDPNEHESLKTSILSEPHLFSKMKEDEQKHHINNIFNGNDDNLKGTALHHDEYSRHVKPEHVRSVLNDSKGDYTLKEIALRKHGHKIPNKEVGKHINDILSEPIKNKEHLNVKGHILTNPNFNKHIKTEHVRNALNDPKSNYTLKDIALSYHHHHLPEEEVGEHINDILSEPTKNDEHDFIKRSLLDNPDFNKHITDKHLNNLANESDFHNFIINHPNVSPDTLHKIAKKSKYSNVHQEIINHPKVESRTLHEIAKKSDNSNVHHAIINHDEVHPYTLDEIAKKSNDYYVHYAIINHDYINPNILHTIAKKSDNPLTHQEILEHDNLHPDTLHEIAKKSNDSNVHKMILNHPAVEQRTKDLINSKKV